MATVTPIRPDVVIPPEPPKPTKPLFASPVCAAPPEPEPPGEFLADCHLCGTRMHHECYWGRVADLDEWREYLRWLNAGNDDEPCPARALPGLPGEGGRVMATLTRRAKGHAE
jgi:hypothetical protein